MGGAVCTRRDCSSHKSLSHDITIILFISTAVVTVYLSLVCIYRFWCQILDSEPYEDIYKHFFPIIFSYPLLFLQHKNYLNWYDGLAWMISSQSLFKLYFWFGLFSYWVMCNAIKIVWEKNLKVTCQRIFHKVTENTKFKDRKFRYVELTLLLQRLPCCRSPILFLLGTRSLNKTLYVAQ